MNGLSFVRRYARELDGDHDPNRNNNPPQGQPASTTKAPDHGGGSNTAAIVVGVLVPVLLIAAIAIAVYIWYRRKYPVRMVLGKDFSRFTNPMYNKRASTLTLVRDDMMQYADDPEEQPKNPVLSLVKEFPEDDENFPSDGEGGSEIKVDVAANVADTEQIKQPKNIVRERPRKARLVQPDAPDGAVELQVSMGGGGSFSDVDLEKGETNEASISIHGQRSRQNFEDSFVVLEDDFNPRESDSSTDPQFTTDDGPEESESSKPGKTNQFDEDELQPSEPADGNPFNDTQFNTTVNAVLVASADLQTVADAQQGQDTDDVNETELAQEMDDDVINETSPKVSAETFSIEVVQINNPLSATNTAVGSEVNSFESHTEHSEFAKDLSGLPEVQVQIQESTLLEKPILSVSYDTEDESMSKGHGDKDFTEQEDQVVEEEGDTSSSGSFDVIPQETAPQNRTEIDEQDSAMDTFTDQPQITGDEDQAEISESFAASVSEEQGSHDDSNNLLSTDKSRERPRLNTMEKRENIPEIIRRVGEKELIHVEVPETPQMIFQDPFIFDAEMKTEEILTTTAEEKIITNHMEKDTAPVMEYPLVKSVATSDVTCDTMKENSDDDISIISANSSMHSSTYRQNSSNPQDFEQISDQQTPDYTPINPFEIDIKVEEERGQITQKNTLLDTGTSLYESHLPPNLVIDVNKPVDTENEKAGDESVNISDITSENSDFGYSDPIGTSTPGILPVSDTLAVSANPFSEQPNATADILSVGNADNMSELSSAGEIKPVVDNTFEDLLGFGNFDTSNPSNKQNKTDGQFPTSIPSLDFNEREDSISSSFGHSFEASSPDILTFTEASNESQDVGTSQSLSTAWDNTNDSTDIDPITSTSLAPVSTDTSPNASLEFLGVDSSSQSLVSQEGSSSLVFAKEPCQTDAQGAMTPDSETERMGEAGQAITLSGTWDMLEGDDAHPGESES